MLRDFPQCASATKTNISASLASVFTTSIFRAGGKIWRHTVGSLAVQFLPVFMQAARSAGCHDDKMHLRSIPRALSYECTIIDHRD